MVAKRSLEPEEDEKDVLLIDSDAYLSEIDGPIEPKPVLKSVIVRPVNFSLKSPVHIIDSERRSKGRLEFSSSHSVRKSKPRFEPRFERRVNAPTKSHSEPPSKGQSYARVLNTERKSVAATHTSRSHSPVIRVSIGTQTEPIDIVPVKTLVTSETQTDKRGQCKCARDTAKRNKKRRIDNKKNKALLCALIKQSENK